MPLAGIQTTETKWANGKPATLHHIWTNAGDRITVVQRGRRIFATVEDGVDHSLSSFVLEAEDWGNLLFILEAVAQDIATQNLEDLQAEKKRRMVRRPVFGVDTIDG